MSNYILKKTLLTDEEQEFLVVCFNRSMAGEELSPEERAEQKRLVKLSEQDEFECLSTFWKCEIPPNVE
jgi:hypothetical protein